MMISCLYSFLLTVLHTPSAEPLVNKKTYPNPFSLRIGFGYELYGGRYRTRTCDLLHVKQMLYQLS